MTLFRPSEQARRPLPRRPSIVSVLDVGSTKICCLIARLTPRDARGRGAPRPHPADRGARLRPPALARHQVRRRRRSRRGRAGDPPRRRCRRAHGRRHGRNRSSSISPAGRLASETYSAQRHASPASRSRRPTSAGCSRPAAGIRSADGRSVIHSLPIGYSLDADSGIADPRGMVGQRLGVDMHVVTADAPPLRNLELCHQPLPSLDRDGGRHALCQRPGGAGRRRGRTRLRLHRFRRRHDHDRRLHEGRVRPRRRDRHRRPAHHHRHRPRPLDQARGRRAAEDDARQRAAEHPPTSATSSRCRRSATTRRACRTRCRARRSPASSGRASRRSSNWSATGSTPPASPRWSAGGWC